LFGSDEAGADSVVVRLPEWDSPFAAATRGDARLTVVLNERIGRVTPDDLEVEGLTEREITRLLRLRERYPYSEFVGSGVEWNRLVFLKWLHQRGRFQQSKLQSW